MFINHLKSKIGRILISFIMADQKISFKNKIMNIRHLYAYLLAFISSVLTFIFFYFSNEIIKEEKIVKKEIDIYEVAKEEAIKLGRMEPDEKPIVQGNWGRWKSYSSLFKLLGHRWYG